MANGHFKKNGVAPKEKPTVEEHKGENSFRDQLAEFVTRFINKGEEEKVGRERGGEEHAGKVALLICKGQAGDQPVLHIAQTVLRCNS